MGVQLLEMAEVLPQHAGGLDIAVGAYPQRKSMVTVGRIPLPSGSLITSIQDPWPVKVQ